MCIRDVSSCLQQIIPTISKQNEDTGTRDCCDGKMEFLKC
jgi:hypothetical protein